MDEQRGIGKNNKLLWHLSSDLKRFKQLTMGHHIVMGRKTFETIGRSLPGRTMLVLSKHQYKVPQYCKEVDSIDAAIHIAQENDEDELFIIGGGEIFHQAMSRTDKIYLTLVHTIADADVNFPIIDLSEWDVIEKKTSIKDENDEYASDYFVYQRKEKHQS
jgi:dihydrofolate reductase